MSCPAFHPQRTTSFLERPPVERKVTFKKTSEGALKSLKNPSMFYSVDDSGIMYSVDSSEEEHR